METPIGLVGIGLVGAALAERLLNAGHAVAGFDISGERSRALEILGGSAAADAAAVADACDTVLLSLMDSDTVRAAIQEDRGILPVRRRERGLEQLGFP